MVGHRAARFAAALLLTSLLVATPATAQEPEFLLLGEDATGDGVLLGAAPSLDTWVDINSFSVATVGEDLVFHMGLQGTTTEVGSYCWMAAFEYGGTEYVGLDCYEGVAYESDNTLSSAYPPSTSRGTNVASDVSFNEDGVLITVPLSAIGASVGDVIDDVYGLTYFTRALTVVDTIPDAKSAAAATESLGSYRVGGPVSDAGPAVQAIFENLTAPAFLHEFTNATSDDYTLNFTVPWQNATIAQTAEVVSGSANVTVLRDGEVFMAFLLTNQTAPAAADDGADGNATDNGTAPSAPVFSGVAGNWSVVIDYEGFVGRLGLELAEHAPVDGPVVDDNATDALDLDADASEGAPGPALPLLVLGLLAVVAVARRRA